MKSQIKSKRRELRYKRQELRRITKDEARAAEDGVGVPKNNERIERVRQEIFQLETQLERELQTAKEKAENRRRLTSVYREKIKNRRQELAQIGDEARAAKDGAERSEQTKRAKKKKQEIFHPERELRAAVEQMEDTPDGRTAPRTADELVTGALPDFVVIGAAKCGTTFFYHLRPSGGAWRSTSSRTTGGSTTTSAWTSDGNVEHRAFEPCSVKGDERDQEESTTFLWRGVGEARKNIVTEDDASVS